MRHSSRSRALSLFVVMLGVMALVAGACAADEGEDVAPPPAPAAEPAAPDSPPAAEEAAPAEPAEAPAPGEAGDDVIRLGYISGGDSDPFVLIVTESIRVEAAKAGVELAECDSNFSAEEALECARTLAVQDLDSMINWQFYPDSAPEICEAYGNLPTVALDTDEKPCQRVWIGANNHFAGVVSGRGLGNFAQATFDCNYDAYVSLDIPSIPAVNTPRAGGSKDGFEEVCGPVPDDKYFSIDTLSGGGDQPENTRRQFTDLLTTLPTAEVILVISPSGDSMPGAALAAAEVAGREGHVWVVGHGADGSILDEIRNNPYWVGDVAYFPESYGSIAVPAAIALAKGEPVDEEILIDHVFIDKTNIDDYYPLEGAEPPEDIRLGYISGGDSDPFVLIVTESIRVEAAKAGVELAECDSNFSAEEALECARTLAVQDLDSMINWQFYPDSAPEICEAYGNLPTVALDTDEKPCQRVWIGANNHFAGVVSGRGLGNFAQATFDCNYDAYVSLDIPSIPAVNTPRAGGSKDGFEEVCGPVPDDKYFSIDTLSGGGDQPENTRRQFTDLLTTLPTAEVILVISPSGDSMPGAALAAAEVAGREGHVWVVGHGADGSILDEIRNNPYWVGDVAYFPESYGSIAVPAAIALAKGEPVDEEILIDHVFIDKTNIDDYYPE